MICHNYYCDNAGIPQIYKGLTNITNNNHIPKAIIEFNLISQKYHKCENYKSNKYRLLIKILNPNINKNIKFDIIRDIIIINDNKYKVGMLNNKEYYNIYNELMKK